MVVAPDPEPLDAAMSAQYELIRQRFVAGLKGRQLEIDAAEGTAMLHAALHRLAGAAGSFGYANLDCLAREALRALEAGAAEQLTSCLERLKQEIHRLTDS